MTFQRSKSLISAQVRYEEFEHIILRLTAGFPQFISFSQDVSGLFLSSSLLSELCNVHLYSMFSCEFSPIFT